MRYTLNQLRGQVLGWGLGIAALGLMMVSFYGIFVEQQANFVAMIAGYPPQFLAFFGGDVASIATPEGFLGMYGFSMLPLIICIFGVIAGSGLLASDEEKGRLDLILAHPVGRVGLFSGRLLALVAATVGILLLGWLGFSMVLGSSLLGVSWGQMALPFVSLLAQALVYQALALLLSMLLPARRLAAGVAGLVMVASYFVSSLSFLDDRLATVGRMLPYHYFQGSAALGGLDAGSFLGLLAASALLALLAWWRFARRDIRVAGEGSWQLPGRLPAAPEEA
jgi:ABC-2 type transport system permease protein